MDRPTPANHWCGGVGPSPGRWPAAAGCTSAAPARPATPPGCPPLRGGASDGRGLAMAAGPCQTCRTSPGSSPCLDVVRQSRYFWNSLGFSPGGRGGAGLYGKAWRGDPLLGGHFGCQKEYFWREALKIEKKPRLRQGIHPARPPPTPGGGGGLASTHHPSPRAIKLFKKTSDSHSYTHTAHITHTTHTPRTHRLENGLLVSSSNTARCLGLWVTYRSVFLVSSTPWRTQTASSVAIGSCSWAWAGMGGPVVAIPAQPQEP